MLRQTKPVLKTKMLVSKPTWITKIGSWIMAMSIQNRWSQLIKWCIYTRQTRKQKRKKIQLQLFFFSGGVIASLGWKSTEHPHSILQWEINGLANCWKRSEYILYEEEEEEEEELKEEEKKKKKKQGVQRVHSFIVHVFF